MAKVKMSFDLDSYLRDRIVASAHDSDLSASDWLRNASKEKLGINEAPRAMVETPAIHAAEENYQVGDTVAMDDAQYTIQPSDFQTTEYWSAKLKDIAAMRPIDGWTALKHATKGIEIPKYLFASRKDLAIWLAEHVK